MPRPLWHRDDYCMPPPEQSSHNSGTRHWPGGKVPPFTWAGGKPVVK